MSWLRLPERERERDAGCFGCLGFLRKPDGEDDSFFDEQSECMIGGGSHGYLGEGSCRKVVPLPGKNRPMCREVPVKETPCLTRREDADGHKMINEYVREGNIGRGSYGKVALYQSNNDGRQYAIKSFYKSRLSKVRVTSSETALEDVHREVSIMKMLEHPNIINLIEVIDDPGSDNFYMVLEYVDGKWICDVSGTYAGLGESTSRRFLKDIISGLMYLQSHDIVHGDIKPENLLVTKSGVVKIGDFSVSHAFEDSNDELWRSPGTPVFTAPECCLGSTYHGKAADVWAVGVTLYCMVIGRCPFIGESFQDTYDKIVNSPLYLPEGVDPELKDLLQRLLCKDPKQRMTLQSASEHPWVIREGGPVPRTLCRCNQTHVPMENTKGSP